MKNLLLSCLFSISTFYSIAQQQIPNGDFEEWGTYSKCSNLDSIGNFMSADELISNYCSPLQSIIKTNSSYSGTYAVKIIPLDISPVGLIANNIRIGTDLTNPDQGIPFSSKPSSLKGYYKGLLGSGDSLGITIKLKNNNGIVAQGKFTQKSNILVDAYTLFEINLNYNSLNTSDPDSLVIFISLGTSNANERLNQNTEIYLDNLTFDYSITTSTTAYASTSPISVYAANKNINFSESVSDVHIVDMIGAQKLQEASNTKLLNAAALTTGMYIVTYKYHNAYFSKKVVIE